MTDVDGTEAGKRPGSPTRPTVSDVRLRELVSTVLWGALAFAGVEFAGRLFGSRATGALVVQAAAAEWACGRLGVAWNDPHAPPATGATVRKRILRGAGLGAAVATLVLTSTFLTRGASVAAASPALGQIVIGLATAIFVAVRQGLFFRGLVARAFGEALPVPALVGLMASCQATAAFASDAPPGGVAFAFVLGAFLGGVTLWDRGLVLSVALHASFTFVVQTIANGGALEVRALDSAWGGGDFGITGGFAATVALTLVAAGLAYGIRLGDGRRAG
ncbi:MAG: CPBP family intramembrane glutamic endopeptidase [Polyangiaceae bacterium]